jgi:hypothetical protein
MNITEIFNAKFNFLFFFCCYKKKFVCFKVNFTILNCFQLSKIMMKTFFCRVAYLFEKQNM